MVSMANLLYPILFTVDASAVIATLLTERCHDKRDVALCIICTRYSAMPISICCVQVLMAPLQ